jgi:hypothetical protein
MTVKANVLWKREGDRVHVSTAKGTYLLNKKASFIWGLIGNYQEDKIIELYEREFGVDETGEVASLLCRMKSLGVVEG